MTIRNAELADVPRLVELSRGMHFESERYSRLAFDEAKVGALFVQLIQGDHGFVMVGERADQIVGGLAAFIAPHWFSSDCVASDLGVFIAPEARGGMLAPRLVSSYLAWAKGRGAKLTQLGISTGIHVEATERLYERLGLSRFGSLFEVS